MKNDISFSYILTDCEDATENLPISNVRGRVCEVVGNVIRAIIPNSKIGETCLLVNPGDDLKLYAEVIGFVDNHTILAPIGELHGISSTTEVIMTGQVQEVPVGNALLGRVVDAFINPIDGKGPIDHDGFYPLYNTTPDPMKREMIKTPFILGVKAVDSLLTMGVGQRIGIFAAAGVGKSKLLSSIIRGSSADVVVLALIGERGRELREFLEYDVGEEGIKKTVVVCSTSDRTSMERSRAAFAATSVAEYFRDKGLNVLFMMDSATRFARALREIGLSAGEPPTRRGFPPSVFTNIPKLMERVGNSDKGSISAIYTVLVEGDDMSEPVADEVRSILDGHIILSSKLASERHYPAIDVLRSISRTRDNVISKEHKDAANKVLKLLSKYQDVEILLKVGEYRKGVDALTDEAVEKKQLIDEFLCQSDKEIFNNFDETVNAIINLAR